MGRVYESAIRIGAAISKAFSRDTQDAARALTKLSTSTKALQFASKSAASLKKLQDTLSSSKAKYDAATEALRRLKEAQEAAGGATKESAKWIKAGERAVAQSAREMDRATLATEKYAAALRKTGVEASRKKLFGDGKADGTPLFAKAGAQVRGIVRDVAVLGTAGAGATAALAALVHKTIEAGDEIGDTADKLGIGSRALQELRFGAKVAGAAAGDLDKALGKMAVTVGRFKAAKGKGGGSSMTLGGLEMLGEGGAEKEGGETDPFKRLHLSAKKLALLQPEQQLMQIADAMGQLKTHADRAAVAQAIFGKGGTALLPFLEQGAAGIAKLSKEAHKFGGVMSDEAVKAAGEADRALTDAKMAVAGLSNTFGAALLPTATRVLTQVSSLVAGNRERIQKWATTTAKLIESKGIPAFLKFGSEALATLRKLMELAEGGARLLGGFDRLAYVMAAARFAPLATTLGKIGTETFKAANSVWKLHAATKAVQGLGPGFSVEGMSASGKALGLAANAAMLLSAGLIGYEIGKALDEWVGASDWLAELLGKTSGQKEKLSGIEAAGVQAHQNRLALQELQRATLVRQFEKKGLSHGQAVYAADQRIQFNIDLSGAVTNEEIKRLFSEAGDKAVDAMEKRKANAQRLAFNE